MERQSSSIARMPWRDENADPDRAARIARLREEERRLAEQVRRERQVVERMRAEKQALQQAIAMKMGWEKKK